MKFNMNKLALLALLTTSSLNAGWVEAQRFVVDGATASFGYSLDVDGRFAVVGSPNEDDGAGAIYIFKKDVNDNFQPFQDIQNLSIDGVLGTGIYYKKLGTDVAVADAGNNNVKIVAGAPNTYDVNIPDTTYHDSTVIFDLNATNQQFYLSKDFNENNGSGAGQSVDVIARTIIPNPQQPTLQISGYIVVTGLSPTSQVKLYNQDASTGTWGSPTTLTHFGSLDKFGASLALRKGNPLLLDYKIKLVVGAPDVDDNGFNNRGKAYVYDLTGSHANGFTWENEMVLAQPTGQIISGGYNANTYFGSAVDIDGSRLIVGAAFKNTHAPIDFNTQGEARVYHLTDIAINHWEQLGNTLYGSNIDETSDRFGMSVAIKNDLAIVGASGLDNDLSAQLGAIYSFKIDDTDTWNETGVVIGREGGNLGYSVAIDGDKPLAGNPDKASLTTYEFQPESVTSTSPAILMYLLN